MNIVSYRGPGMAGGVSSALARLWLEHVRTTGTWWHLSGTHLHAAEQMEQEPRELIGIPKEVVEGHYRYCNEFLWPVMHDLPEYARYRAEDHKLYVVANRIITRSIVADSLANHQHRAFVQDYQMALLPELLGRSSIGTLVFWHIPWPRSVEQQHIPQLVQVAKGLVAAEVLGFHTEEYAQNFLHFVHRNLHAVLVDFEKGTVTRGATLDAGLPWSTGEQGDPIGKTTTVVVAPLGIDTTFWKNSAIIPQIRLHSHDFSWLHQNTPYVLSVDRADYTKGVIERFHAIDRFLDLNPQWRGKVNFVQICGRTRIGLEAFDAYWHRCKVEAAKLESKWRTDHWSPLMWIEQPCSSAELSGIYRDAAVMLVNPVRDGLNLTAKEFVASQVRKPGILALSAGAGAWHELGDEAIRLEPSDPVQMAAAIAHGLEMNQAERARRITKMKLRLADNTLTDWWRLIAANIVVAAPQPSSQLINNLRSVH